MQTKPDKNIIAILRAFQDTQRPIGGTVIARKIQSFGINLSPRTVRYYLALTDKAGFTKNLGNKRGRVITPVGKKEVSNAFVMNKIGRVASKIDALSYKMKFSFSQLSGNIVLNISTIKLKDLENALKYIKLAFQKELGMGKYVAFGKPDSLLGDFLIPAGKIAIGTVCSVTVNGIFLKAGIPVFSRFGGLLEMRNGQPVRFTEIIEYSGSTLDPLEIFIKGNMTSVYQAASSGNGLIGVSFREIPAVAISEANKLKKKLIKIGLGGILLIGKPGQALLDIPVSEGRAAMIVVGGLNPIAACEENGIETHNLAMKTLFEFKMLFPFDQLKKFTL
jgi:repressor of nif and glnA expression